MPMLTGSPDTYVLPATLGATIRATAAALLASSAAKASPGVLHVAGVRAVAQICVGIFPRQRHGMPRYRNGAVQVLYQNGAAQKLYGNEHIQAPAKKSLCSEALCLCDANQ